MASELSTLLHRKHENRNKCVGGHPAFRDFRNGIDADIRTSEIRKRQNVPEPWRTSSEVLVSDRFVATPYTETMWAG